VDELSLQSPDIADQQVAEVASSSFKSLQLHSNFEALHSGSPKTG
jgi:hypothetical protein